MPLLLARPSTVLIEFSIDMSTRFGCNLPAVSIYGEPGYLGIRCDSGALFGSDCCFVSVASREEAARFDAETGACSALARVVRADAGEEI